MEEGEIHSLNGKVKEDLGNFNKEDRRVSLCVRGVKALHASTKSVLVFRHEICKVPLVKTP